MSLERADSPRPASISAEHRRQDPPGQRHARRPDLVCEQLDDEAVIYDARTGAVHHLDAGAHWIWEGCDGRRSREELVAAYSERFNMPLANAVAAFDQGLQQLIARDLLLDMVKTDGPSFGGHAGDRPGPFADALSDGPTCTSLEAGSARQAIAPLERTAPSRRELLSRGATRAALAAPVVSTFFATGALASGPSYSAAFGEGGCKTVGYSCAVNADCCQPGTSATCQDQGGPTKTCCVQHSRPGCVIDNDCCNAGDVCNAGTCE